MSEPAYTRLDVDERRRRLLELEVRTLIDQVRDATSARIAEPAQPERIRRRAV